MLDTHLARSPSDKIPPPTSLSRIHTLCPSCGAISPVEIESLGKVLWELHMEAYAQLVQTALSQLLDGELQEGITLLEMSFSLRPGNRVLQEHLSLARHALTIETREELLSLTRFLILGGEYGYARAVAAYVYKTRGADAACMQLMTLADSARNAQEQGQLMPHGSPRQCSTLCEEAGKHLLKGTDEEAKEAKSLYEKALSIRPYDAEALRGYALSKMYVEGTAEELQNIGRFLVAVRKNAAQGQLFFDVSLRRMKAKLEYLFGCS